MRPRLSSREGRAGTAEVTPVDPRREAPNEHGLARQLSSVHQTTMALGGAIGTGLFLASGLAVNVAGPAVIASYVIVAVVSLLLGRALTEMAVAHPTAGAFGVYASMYISPFAGYAVAWLGGFEPSLCIAALGLAGGGLALWTMGDEYR